MYVFYKRYSRKENLYSLNQGLIQGPFYFLVRVSLAGCL